MTFDKIIDKPFFIGNYDWATTAAAGSFLFNIDIPDGILLNALAKIPFTSTTYYNTKMCALLQVSGSPMHSGIIVVGAFPNMLAPERVNQFLMAPHMFLNANEATSVCLEIPWYSSQNVIRTSTEVGEFPFALNNYASLVAQIVNPLRTNGSTTLTLSLHIVFKEANFYVPKPSAFTWVEESDEREEEAELAEPCSYKSWLQKLAISLLISALGRVMVDSIFNLSSSGFEPEGFVEDLLSIPTKIFDGLATGAKVVTGDLIDTMRGGLRELTGFHNPNSPAINLRVIQTPRNFGNNVDQPNLFEKLDQHAQHDRITQDTIFNTKQDEMDVYYILNKKSHVGTFRVNAADSSGTRLFAQPITPMVEADQNGYTSVMRTFYEASRYWRGPMKLYIQSSMTNFQYCKLLITKNYTGNENQFSSYIPMLETVNMLTDTLEFSAGGQVLEVDLPYCAVTDQLECTKYLESNAIMHGIYTIYLLQPLVTNDSSPLDAEFNVYVGPAPGFQFYGYSTDLIEIAGLKPPIPFHFIQSEKIAESVDTIEKLEKDVADVFAPSSERRFIKNQLKLEKRLEAQFKTINDLYSEMIHLGENWTKKITALEKQLNKKSTKSDLDKLLERLDKEEGISETDKVRCKEVLNRLIEARSIDEKSSKSDDKFEAEAEVIIDESSQATLNPERIDENPSLLRAVDFKPMISVRDYMRRMVNIAQFEVDGNELNHGIVKMSIKQMLLNDGLVAGNMAIKDLFWGFNGGVKIKLVVTGCIDGHAYYIPPSIRPGPRLDTVNRASSTTIGDTTTNPEFFQDMGYHERGKAYGYVVQESAIVRASVGTNNREDNNCIFEFVIPNMNPYRFISGQDFYPDTGMANQSTSDMGFIVVSPHIDLSENVSVEVFLGFTDETRFGYQVFGSYKYPALVSGIATNGLRRSGFNTLISPYRPFTDTSLYPGAYFAKT